MRIGLNLGPTPERSAEDERVRPRVAADSFSVLEVESMSVASESAGSFDPWKPDTARAKVERVSCALLLDPRSSMERFRAVLPGSDVRGKLSGYLRMQSIYECALAEARLGLRKAAPKRLLGFFAVGSQGWANLAARLDPWLLSKPEIEALADGLHAGYSPKIRTPAQLLQQVRRPGALVATGVFAGGRKAKWRRGNVGHSSLALFKLQDPKYLLKETFVCMQTGELSRAERAANTILKTPALSEVKLRRRPGVRGGAIAEAALGWIALQRRDPKTALKHWRALKPAELNACQKGLERWRDLVLRMLKPE